MIIASKIQHIIDLCPDDCHLRFQILLKQDKSILEQQLDFILVAFCGKS